MLLFSIFTPFYTCVFNFVFLNLINFSLPTHYPTGCPKFSLLFLSISYYYIIYFLYTRTTINLFFSCTNFLLYFSILHSSNFSLLFFHRQPFQSLSFLELTDKYSISSTLIFFLRSMLLIFQFFSDLFRFLIFELLLKN